MHRKLISLASLVLALGTAGTASATVIFDTRGDGITNANLADETVFSGAFQTAFLEDGTFTTAGAHTVAGISLGYSNNALVPVETDVLISFWDTVNYSAAPANSAQIGTTYRFTLLAAPSAHETLFVLPGGPIVIPDSTFGVIVNFVDTGTNTPNVDMDHLFRNTPVTLGTSSEFAGYDLNSNGIISGGTTEIFAWNPTFPEANMYFALYDAVPEPGSLAMLGMGAVGFLRRRRSV